MHGDVDEEGPLCVFSDCIPPTVLNELAPMEVIISVFAIGIEFPGES